MAVSGTEPLVVVDEFVKVILADPDLLDEAFAAVLESWDATPPTSPPTAGTAVGRPGHREVPLAAVHDDCAGWVPALQREVLRAHVARSPPAARS
jgi:hypothetical protein